MRPRKAGRYVLVAALLAASACGRITDMEGLPTVRVLSETVQVQRSADFVGFEVETLVHNASDKTIYRIPCGLTIERRQGSGWPPAYTEACLEDQRRSSAAVVPIAIGPGQQRLEIVELRAAPGAEPPLLRDLAVPAELRLVLPLAYTAGDLDAPGRVVGRQARTSNPFALVP